MPEGGCGRRGGWETPGQHGSRLYKEAPQEQSLDLDARLGSRELAGNPPHCPGPKEHAGKTTPRVPVTEAAAAQTLCSPGLGSTPSLGKPTLSTYLRCGHRHARATTSPKNPSMVKANCSLRREVNQVVPGFFLHPWLGQGNTQQTRGTCKHRCAYSEWEARGVRSQC